MSEVEDFLTDVLDAEGPGEHKVSSELEKQRVSEAEDVCHAVRYRVKSPGW